MREKLKDKQVIAEELEEYYYEKFGRAEEERENEKRYNTLMNKQYARKQKIIFQVVNDYMIKNPQDICNRCLKECDLIKEFINSCGYVGLKVKWNDDETEARIESFPKGIWDDGFTPLTDEDIKNIKSIF